MDPDRRSNDQPLNESAPRRARAPILFIVGLFLLAIVVLAVWPRAVAGSDSGAAGKTTAANASHAGAPAKTPTGSSHQAEGQPSTGKASPDAGPSGKAAVGAAAAGAAVAAAIVAGASATGALDSAGKDQPGASTQSSSPPAPGEDEQEAVNQTRFCTRFEKKSFTLATGKSQKGDLYFFGKTARIDGTLEGDVFVFGESAIVGGTVTDDLNAAVAHVMMNGKVGDDVRIVCQDASINGPIGGDLLAGGSTITTMPTADVGGRTLIAAGKAFLSGHFRGPVQAGGGEVVFGGIADGDVRIDSDVIELDENAHIKGNFTYSARKELDLFEGAPDKAKKQVEGTVTYVPRAPKKRSAGGGGHPFIRLWSFIAAFVLGAFLLYLAPNLTRTIKETAQADILKSLGFGVLGHIFLPFAAVILVVLCVTLPAGVFLLLGWGALFYLGKLVVSFALADSLMKWLGWKVPPIVTLLIGMVPVWLLFMVPVLGSLLYWFVVPVFGIGAILIGVHAYSKQRLIPAPPAAPAPVLP
jgi:cytoskeletal protein CcmA (bactofilin family)